MGLCTCVRYATSFAENTSLPPLGSAPGLKTTFRYAYTDVVASVGSDGTRDGAGAGAGAGVAMGTAAGTGARTTAATTAATTTAATTTVECAAEAALPCVEDSAYEVRVYMVWHRGLMLLNEYTHYGVGTWGN